LDREEMIRILEEIARDPNVNPTARCTAVRDLKEFPEPPADDELLYGGDNVLPMTGPVGRANKRREAEH
jgi:hypothetical protein